MTGGSSWNKEQSTYELIKQWKAHKPNIWVATPGRLIQMVQTKSFHLHKISFLVLDEADKMLDMGFESQVTSILQNLNPQRQTCMMSATFHNKLEQTARKWLQNPIRYVPLPPQKTPLFFPGVSKFISFVILSHSKEEGRKKVMA